KNLPPGQVVQVVDFPILTELNERFQPILVVLPGVVREFLTPAFEIHLNAFLRWEGFEIVAHADPSVFLETIDSDR
ncbi:hypothetical protein DJ72_04300, partial [Halorubrum distributum]